mmetsp:Transcript_70141/g.203394  ORF Transcript_70141/g.203394 Transcript_70141/m.203394 type:complete len:184 (+) Transcript_70141:345-896(+)
MSKLLESVRRGGHAAGASASAEAFDFPRLAVEGVPSSQLTRVCRRRAAWALRSALAASASVALRARLQAAGAQRVRHRAQRSRSRRRSKRERAVRGLAQARALTTAAEGGGGLSPQKPCVARTRGSSNCQSRAALKTPRRGRLAGELYGSSERRGGRRSTSHELVLEFVAAFVGPPVWMAGRT